MMNLTYSNENGYSVWGNYTYKDVPELAKIDFKKKDRSKISKDN